MVLSYEQIKSVAAGAVRFGLENDWVRFYRFTKEQEDVLEGGFKIDSQSCSSVVLDFTTDAEFISLKWKNIQYIASGKLQSDICVDGLLTWSFGYISDGYGCVESQGFDVSEGEFCLPLPKGSHRIQIMLCDRCRVLLKNVDLKNATFFEPYKKKINLLCLGDSITQGHGTDHPSMTYVNRLSEALNANVINLGIGGLGFNYKITESVKDCKPDIITIAWGTNDWVSCTRDQTLNEIEKIKNVLHNHFKNSEIYIITPIWRADSENGVPFRASKALNGDFFDYVNTIKSAFSEYTVIDGLKLLPHATCYFADMYAHPNDYGAVLYADSLRREISKTSKYSNIFN